MAKATHQFHETYLAASEPGVYATYLVAAHPRKDNLTAVILHGAGRADSSRHRQLAEWFAEEGVSVVSLDFVGHGKTGGVIGDNSLEKRSRHALAAIRYWTDETTPLIVCGFSMSGHTSLGVALHLGNRVKSLGLFCPAVYAAEAEVIAFGPAFTKIIRMPQKWQSSPALKTAADFTGRAAIIVGSDDQVIPGEVIATLRQALTQHASQLQVEVLPGVAHQLAKWLTEHEDFTRNIIRYLIGEQA